MSSPKSPPTRDALIDAGLRCFGESGFEGSRLSDITSKADVTTGAFYGYFASKLEFFNVLFDRYGSDIQAALDRAPTLREQFVAYIEESRQHRGVVRASAELLQRVPEHTVARRALRDSCAWRLRLPATARQSRAASRLLVDVLENYAFLEAAELMAVREPDEVARALSMLIETGLYKA